VTTSTQARKEIPVRRFIVQQRVTVDNIAAEADGGLSIVSGEPFSETTDPVFEATLVGFIDSVDTMMLGANSYAPSKDYWTYAAEQGEWGEKLNNLTKFVSSSTLDDACGDFPAATVTRDPTATNRELKAQSGKGIWMWGSLTLMGSLLDAGVVDEVRMLACPASRGKGTRLFEDSRDPRLLEATSYGNGIALLLYAVTRSA
jgi:dihydrofolate reductase